MIGRYFSIYDSITVIWAAVLVLWMGIMYWLLRQSIVNGNVPAKRSLFFGGIVIGMDWISFKRKVINITFLLLLPVLLKGQPSPYNGVWLNRSLFDRLSSGVEPKVALKDCGNPTSINFYDVDALMMSWNNHEGSPMLYMALDDGSIETTGMTPNGIKMGMKYRMIIHDEDGIDILSVYQLEPREEKQDDLVRYPDEYGDLLAPQGMIITRFLSGDYTLVGYPDSTVSIHGDRYIKGWEPYRSLHVGFDCVEECTQNHVYLHPSVFGHKPKGDAFVWERSGDTLIIYEYQWEELKFHGEVGEERLRLVRQYSENIYIAPEKGKPRN